MEEYVNSANINSKPLLACFPDSFITRDWNVTYVLPISCACAWLYWGTDRAQGTPLSGSRHDVVLEPKPLTVVSWMYRKRKKFPWGPQSVVWVPRICETASPFNKPLAAVRVKFHCLTLRTLSNTDLYKLTKAHLIYVTCIDSHFLKRQMVYPDNL